MCLVVYGQLIKHVNVGYFVFTAGRVMVARLMVVNRCNLATSGPFVVLHTSSSPECSIKAYPLCRSNCSIYVRHFSDDISSSGSEGTSSSDEEEWTSLFDKVAKASLSFVGEHGWSLKAVQAGVKSLGLPGVTHGVLKNGGHDLLKYFEEECNSQLVDYLRHELEPALFNEEPERYVTLCESVCCRPPCGGPSNSFVL